MEKENLNKIIDIYKTTIWGDPNDAKKLIDTFGKERSNYIDIIPPLVYLSKTKWAKKFLDKIVLEIEDETSDFQLLDELIYFVTFVKNSDRYFDKIAPIVTNLKLRLELTTSILEKDKEKGGKIVEMFLNSEEVGEISVGIFLVHQFKMESLKPKLKELLKQSIAEDIKYQIMFTLASLKDQSIFPVILKGATIKNDKQLDYLEAIQSYDPEKYHESLEKIAKSFLGNKIVKLKIAEILYKYDPDFSNSIFSKFIKSKKLDLQGYTLELLTTLKNDKYISEITPIFQKKNHFHTHRAIRYFSSINYITKLPEIKKYYSDIEKRSVREAIIQAVTKMEKDCDKQKEFLETVEDRDKIDFMKNIMLKQLKIKSES